MEKGQEGNELKIQETLDRLTNALTTLGSRLDEMQTKQDRLSSTLENPTRLAAILKSTNPPQSDSQENELDDMDFVDTTPKALAAVVQRSLMGQLNRVLEEKLKPLTEKLEGSQRATEELDRRTLLRTFYSELPKAKGQEAELQRLSRETGIDNPYTLWKMKVGEDEYNRQIAGSSERTSDLGGLDSSPQELDLEIEKGASVQEITRKIRAAQEKNPEFSLSPADEDVDPFEL